MYSKELRGLIEAYSEVYAPQENIEEGLRSAVKRLLGGRKKEAEAPKPESRGAELRRRYNVGPERSDTSAKRQILDRSRAKAERDGKEFGGSKYSQSVANQSQAAHDRYLRAGYSKYGADDARGSGNKARKRAATLNIEQFEFIVNSLIGEGYDLSSYTYDEMYEICLGEVGQIDELDTATIRSAIKKGNVRTDARMDAGDVAGATRSMTNVDRSKRALAKKDPGRTAGTPHFSAGSTSYKEELDIFDTVLEFLYVEGYAETLEEAEWMMANIIDEEAVDIILGEAIDPKGAARMDAAKPKKKIDVFAYDKKVAAMKASKDAKMNKEEYMDEAQDATPPKGQSKYGRKAPAGYMQTRKPTLQQMSSREKQAFKDRGIGEEYVDEAQVANRDPDKYEREQSKKSAPVRGEKTPMPPRGDKRREDFEKWYAANVR